ncbi:MAG: DUF4129 domain-containing protein [Acidobacteriota bacterium]|nr:DUF4129 domain-containing protein [Acidobacteriota bacterium]
MALGMRQRSSGGALAFLACAAMLAAAPARAQSPVPAASVPVASRRHDVSVDEYRAHLQALTALVEACAKARDLTHCDPLLVGPDDRIPLAGGASAERRLVRYGWLRVLFSKAEEPDEPAPAPTRDAGKSPRQEDAQPAPPATSQMLQLAVQRLARDLAQAGASAAPEPAHTAERNTMRQVLDGPDFSNLEQPTATNSMLEKAGKWLNHLFQSAAALRSRSPWVGRVLVLGFILAVCAGLGWGLLQLERRWRVRLAPESLAPAPQSASARNWQLWLDDARRAAAAGQWREAIHFVYWSAIARLEAKRLWPADRARTPREYLALVAADDPRSAGLAQLTRSFERTWYGGRPAAESDYRQAEQLATALIAGASAASHAEGGAR